MSAEDTTKPIDQDAGERPRYIMVKSLIAALLFYLGHMVSVLAAFMFMPNDPDSAGFFMWWAIAAVVPSVIFTATLFVLTRFRQRELRPTANLTATFIGIALFVVMLFGAVWKPIAGYVDEHEWAGYVLIAGLAITPSILGIFLTRHRVKPGHCLKCEYDLRASKDRCPECGTAIPYKPIGPAAT